MPSTRWRKVFRDLWGNKTRTGLVVLSIAVGVFAIGMVAGSQVILERDVTASYMAINPASATLYTDPFDDNQVEVVHGMKQVAEAGGVRRLSVRLKTGSDQWTSLQLYARPDYNDIRINKIFPVSGDWPPPKHTMLVERASLASTKAKVGDAVTIEMPDGKQRDLLVSGLTYDITRPPSSFTGVAFGYVTMDTLEWLGQPRTFNQLDIVVTGDVFDQKHIREVGNQVRDKVEQGGLGLMGTMSLNVVERTREIGVMRAIGASDGAVLFVVIGEGVLIGVLSWIARALVSLPLSKLLSDAVGVAFLNDQLNYTFSIDGAVIWLVFVVVLSAIASALPARAASRLSVREVLAYE